MSCASNGCEGFAKLGANCQQRHAKFDSEFESRWQRHAMVLSLRGGIFIADRPLTTLGKPS
jgi:hypothetical protein